MWRSKERASTDAPESSLSAEILSNPEFPMLIRRFLFSRGFLDSSEAQKFISPKLSELKDPFLILNMEQACERLVQAFSQQEMVCVYADFDLDGTSGLALLDDGLRQLGFQNIVLAQPKRLSDGYGFHSHIVEDLHKQGVKLIVTVDVGITALEACETAKKLGIDVIITDHHQMAAKLPDAFSVVNPNQKQDTSGLGYLCGAGVGFYLLRATKRKLVQKGLITENHLDLRSLLDCFAIATLTDMVPLVEDNRVLVKAGLVQLEKTTRPGLRALMSSLDLSGRSLTSQDVAIKFAPKLNALSRMETGILPIDIYIESDAKKAQEMIKSVLKNNSTRVQLQGEGESEALEFLKSWPHKNFVFVASENFHRGVVGLIATKVCLQENVPTFVGSISSEGVITGSARLPNGYGLSLLDAMAAGRSVLNRFGGHDAAAGFELHLDQKENLIQCLVEYFNKKDLEMGEQAVRSVEYDVELNLAEVTENLMKWFDAMGPYGQNFSTPILRFRRVILREVNQLRGGHLKLKLEETETHRRFDGMFFSPAPTVLQNLPAPGTQVDVLGELQWNYFAGKKSIQILIKDYKLSESV